MTMQFFTGNLFIVTAPSGTGKTSLVKAWLEQSERLHVSVSYTTRSQRAGEENGKDYHFVDDAAFESMIEKDAFFEYATVFGNSYGTAKQGIFDLLAQDQDVVLEIDWQGAEQVREIYPQAISVFILPPSLEALRSRLQGRGREDDAEIERRFNEAKLELSHYNEADFLVVNDNFDEALAQLLQLQASMELLVENQQTRYHEMLQNLLD